MTVILLVDDEKSVLDSLCDQLGALYRDKVECEAAESAEEAWEVLGALQAGQTPVIVVVSDWLMPGQRGDEFLARVRRSYPTIGRILLTGQADPAALERARTDAAVHEILFKPWTSAQLRDAIVRSARGLE